MSSYSCPHCGEEVDTEPDRGAGEEMEYVEDCPVCCRPNVLSARYEPELDEYVVAARRE
jgi:hypothetical protein